MLIWLVLFSFAGESMAQRLHVATPADNAALRQDTTELGEAAGSQPLEVTVRLGPTAAQSADLQQLLLAQTTASSPEYHRWLTPVEFEQRFGWTVEDRQNLIDWLARYGLSARPDRSTASRLVFQATVQQASTAFAVQLQQFSNGSGRLYLANSTAATLPTEFAGHVVSVSGLDDLPKLPEGRLSALSLAAQSRSSVQSAESATDTAAPETKASTNAASTTGLLQSLEDAAAANSAAVIALQSSMCAGQISSAERDAFHLALEQVQAQGITVLVTGSCTAAPESADRVFPSALSEVAAVSVGSGDAVPTQATGSELRPAWQVSSGLPTNSLRQAPDFSVSSVSDLESTVLTLVEQTGNRIGNLSPTLYALQHEPELFDRLAADGTSSSSAVDWTPASGLGTLNLQELLRLYPRAVTSTTTSLVSSSYSVNYGTGFTLTATVTPSAYGTANPSGTVTFTSSTQGVLGSAAINSSGVATLTPSVLPVGQYTITANYAGDTNYANSSSSSSVVVTVSMVTATVQATIAPQTNVPYGATATVTVTVSLPGPNATPTGTVTARILDVTGALYTATLSPNPGLNTATANIIVSVPPAGSHPIQVTCQGTTNFQCQSPANLTLTTIQGYSNTTLAVTPAVPQAGDPVTITATVSDAGNGTGAYAFGGSVSFFDSGKLIATAPVATNQATTTVALSGNRVHNLSATYTGDSNWGSSTSTAIAVSPIILSDTLSLTSNAPNGISLSGVNLTFTATDTATTATASNLTPTGTVTFYDTFNGSVVTLGSPSVLVPNGTTAGIATFNTTGLQPGTHAVYAVYSGDANYAPATSAVTTVSLSSFSLTMTPSTLTLDQGKSQGISVQVTAGGGYTGSVSLGCTPPPSSETTCSFSPAAVAGGGTSTLTIVTTAPSVAKLEHGPPGPGLWSVAGGASLAALAAWMLPRRSRRLPTLLAMTCVTAFALSALGCGLGILNSNVNGSGSGSSSSSSSSSSGSSADGGTPLGTQNFTLTAAGSDGTNTVRHTYQYQVTVQ